MLSLCCDEIFWCAAGGYEEPRVTAVTAVFLSDHTPLHIAVLLNRRYGKALGFAVHPGALLLFVACGRKFSLSTSARPARTHGA